MTLAACTYTFFWPVVGLTVLLLLFALAATTRANEREQALEDELRSERTAKADCLLELELYRTQGHTFQTWREEDER